VKNSAVFESVEVFDQLLRQADRPQTPGDRSAALASARD
jgi:hypothetical protein